MAEKSKKKRALKGQVAGIVLEDLDSKLDMIIEMVKGSEERIERRIVGLENRFDEMKEDHVEQIRGIRLILDAHDRKLNQHEGRIGTLEKSVRH